MVPPPPIHPSWADKLKALYWNDLLQAFWVVDSPEGNSNGGFLFSLYDTEPCTDEYLGDYASTDWCSKMLWKFHPEPVHFLKTTLGLYLYIWKWPGRVSAQIRLGPDDSGECIWMFSKGCASDEIKIKFTEWYCPLSCQSWRSLSVFYFPRYLLADLLSTPTPNCPLIFLNLPPFSPDYLRLVILLVPDSKRCYNTHCLPFNSIFWKWYSYATTLC